MTSSLKRSSSLLLYMACLFVQKAKSNAQSVLAVQEVRVISTSGLVAAKSADGKTVTITLTNAPGAETPIAATQGPGSTFATGAASNAFISIPSAGSFMMGPNTQVKLPKAEETAHTLELLKGQLFMNISAEEVKKSGAATFRLKTPAALLAVKGTRFFAVSEGKTDIAGVHQGMVEVYESISKQMHALNPGTAVEVSHGQLGKERPLTKEETIYEKFYSMSLPKNGFINSLGMKFVPVSGTKVFFCIHETRRQDYSAFAAEVSGLAVSWKLQTWNGTPCGQEDSHPVVGVSWADAQKFCKWLGKKEGKTYRLPTNDEWRIAAGPEEFPWEGEFPPKIGGDAGNYADTAYREKFPREAEAIIDSYTDGFATSSPVMSFKPNKFGIYDLGGNVWEWCEDWYDVMNRARVLPGGSWRDYERDILRLSNRDYFPPGRYQPITGFRCVQVVDGG